MSNRVNDQWLKSKIEASKVDTPAVIEKKIELTLQSRISTKKYPNRRWISMICNIAIVSVILLGFAFGTAYISPSLAHTYQSIPVLGSAFKLIGDVGLMNADERGIVSGVGEVYKVGDSTIVITDVVYDVSRIIIGYSVNNHITSPDFRDFRVNGRSIDSQIKSVGREMSKDNWMGLIFLNLRNQNTIEDDTTLSFHIRHYDNIQEKWERFRVEIPVQQTIAPIYEVDYEKSFEKWTIHMNKIILSPLSTQIKLDLITPYNTYRNNFLSYYLYDDQGRMLELLDLYGSGGDENDLLFLKQSILFEPLDNIPEYLMLVPYIETFSRIKKHSKNQLLWEGKPLTLPQGTAGTVTVKDIEFFKDNTKVTYVVEGDDIFVQANALLLMDDNRIEYEMIGNPIRISNTNNTFTSIFPRIESDELIKVITYDIQKAEKIEELAIKIPFPIK